MSQSAAMQRSNSYSYPQHQGTSTSNQSRYPAAHNSSSAFSASANPNEDWTKISDLAERRRIQNRIAQRNYRKKLKRRLEDLERRAGSTSVSPEQSHSELAVPSPHSQRRSSPSSSRSMARQPSQASSTYSQEQQLSPELFPVDDHFAGSASRSAPQFSLSSPPSYPYANYPPSTEYFPSDYQVTNYSHLPHIYSDSQYQPDYMQSLPPTLPSMLPSDHVKQENFFGDDDLLTPFSMNYASLAGIDVPTTQAYASYPARTPPLTEAFPYGDSRENSPPHFMLPMTPTSRSASPNVRLFETCWQ